MGAVLRAVFLYPLKQIRFHYILPLSPGHRLLVLCRGRYLQDEDPLLASDVVDLYLAHATLHRARARAQVKNKTLTM